MLRHFSYQICDRFHLFFHPELLKGDLQAPVQFSGGLVAGILASAITQPADVIKTKMQLYPQLYTDVRSVLMHLHNVRN